MRLYYTHTKIDILGKERSSQQNQPEKVAKRT